jgi:hypothetical protein
MIGTTAALLGSAALGLGGSFLSSQASKKAAKTQAAAAQRAEAKFAPFYNAGQGAVTTLGQLFGIGADGQQTGQADFSNFFQSPDYEFARGEGLKALEFSNAAKGQLNSGNNMRDLVSFGQGLATQNFGNYFNRLLQLSQLGSNAAAGQAEQIGNQGQAKASGIIGSANAINQGLSSFGNNLMMSSVFGGGQTNPSAYANNPAQANLYSPQAWGATYA